MLFLHLKVYEEMNWVAQSGWMREVEGEVSIATKFSSKSFAGVVPILFSNVKCFPSLTQCWFLYDVYPGTHSRQPHIFPSFYCLLPLCLLHSLRDLVCTIRLLMLTKLGFENQRSFQLTSTRSWYLCFSALLGPLPRHRSHFKCPRRCRCQSHPLSCRRLFHAARQKTICSCVSCAWYVHDSFLGTRHTLPSIDLTFWKGRSTISKSISTLRDSRWWSELGYLVSLGKTLWGRDQKERRLGRENSKNPEAERVCSVGETAKCSWRTAN